MRFYFFLIGLLVYVPQVMAQDYSWVKRENIENMTKMYEQFFIENKTWMEEGIGRKENTVTGLWGCYAREQGLRGGEASKPGQGLGREDLDLGLKWVSNASHNFRKGMGESEDLYYSTRVSTGIDWLLIGEGSWQKGLKEREAMKTQIEIDFIEEKLGREQMLLVEKLAMAAEIFDFERMKIWERYAQMLEKQTVLNDSLYKYKMIAYPQKLSVDHRLDRVLETINRLGEYLPDQEGQKDWQQYVDLPYERAYLPSIKRIKQQDLLMPQEEVLRLKNELALEESKNRKGISLRAQLRYNYYEGFSNRNRARFFPSIGASLSVPLQGAKGVEAKRKYEEEQRALKILQEKKQVKAQLLRRHRNYTDLEMEVLDIKNRMTYLEEQMKRELELRESMSDYFSPSKYNDYLQEYAEEHIKYLDIKQKMLEDYLVFITLAGLDESNSIGYQKEGGISTYLWKDDFKERENKDIVDILKKYHINNVLLSPGESKGEKVRGFLQLCRKEGIEVQRLLSENSYTDFRREDNAQLLNKLSEIKKSGFAGVHLNFEPHTQKDYNENKEKYIQKLNEVYALAVDWCKGYNISLSVSAPMHLPEENIKQLKERGIRTYVMAYGEVNQDKLLKRTEAIRQSLKGQYVWVLRNTDFVDAKALEAAVAMLYDKGVRELGFYHFGTIGLYGGH